MDQRKTVQSLQGWILTIAAALVGTALCRPLAAQPINPAERSQIVLNAARTAYNQQDYAFAAEKFREFLQMRPGHGDLLAGRYGLALALMNGSQKDYQTAVQCLVSVVPANFKFADRPYALYYLGLAYRGLADRDTAMATTRPAAQAATLQNTAARQLRLAANAFEEAVQAFTPATPPPAAAQPSLPMEWTARARCDLAQVQLLLGRYKEAQAAAQPVTDQPSFGHSRYRHLALYYLGYAGFAQRDYALAVRSLAQLAPFDQPDFGPHAEFLMARTHHLAGDRAEAAAAYQGVISTFEQQRKAAAEALKNAGALSLTPAQKTQYQKISTGALPDYVTRSTFYLGMLLYEQHAYPEAAQRFSECLANSPQPALVGEAQLHLGICQVQSRLFTAALKTLANFPDPALADRALRWLAKAQMGLIDPKYPTVREKLINAAIANLQKSADLLKNASAGDSDARDRLANVLIELGDAERSLEQFKQAAATYAHIPSAGVSPELVEHALHRQLVSLQLAGEFGASDEACRRFISTYPRSELMPDVLARYAENAMLAVSSGAVKPTDPGNRYAEALRRFKTLQERYPQSSQAILATQAQAMALYENGKYADAAKLLSTVPEADRLGDLGSVSYLEGDCLLRTLPTNTDDALATNRLIQQLDRVISLMNAFIQSQSGEPRPEAPEANFKLAYAYAREADLIADPVEKQKQTTMARRTLAEILANYRNSPVYALAVYETARMQEQRGAGATAAEEFARFAREPFSKSPFAPIALILEGDSLRLSRKPEQAVAYLTRYRAQNEQAMLKDPKLAQYVPVLQYSLALSLKEAGQLDKAIQLFRSIARDFPKRPEAADVPWRVGQCMRDQASDELETARRAYWNSARPELREKALAEMNAAVARLRQAADFLATGADKLADDDPDSDLPMQMNYDAAWTFRKISEVEIEDARRQLQQQALQKLIAALPKDDPSIPSLRPPEIPLSEIPLQPSEKLARQRYSALIDTGLDSPLVVDATFELAEMMGVRGEHAMAIRMLNMLVGTTQVPATAQRVRLRLGAAYLAAGDPKSAATQFQAVIPGGAVYNVLYARAGLGEALYLQKDWAGVVRELQPLYADRRAAQRLPGVTDRADLRLASAYGQLGRWQDARNVLENFATRHRGSSLLYDARFAYAQACQHLKQYDQAASAYVEVSRRVGGEVGAESHLQAGLCYLALGKAPQALSELLMVAYAYDYPNLTGQALCEAAKICLAQKRPADARKHLQYLLAQQPDGTWAKAARAQLSQIK